MTTSLVRQVADVLRAYLAIHPRAVDTVEGIHAWWLTERVPEHTLDVTQQALELLEADGLVERHLPSHRTVWRRRTGQGDDDGAVRPAST
ncbi:hypothetical protein P3W24_12000 [Luteibacter sp. PPL201]|uniref:Uncharacterized protein n=1 Tax=Luteibacter sahnii TaxID=3021977 RepID=A0ABT6BCA9_9GAMM